MEDYRAISATIVEGIRHPEAYDMPSVADRMRKQAADAKLACSAAMDRLSAAGADQADVIALLDACLLAANMGLVAQIIDAAAPVAPQPSMALH